MESKKIANGGLRIRFTVSSTSPVYIHFAANDNYSVSDFKRTKHVLGFSISLVSLYLSCFPTHWSRCNAAKWIFLPFYCASRWHCRCRCCCCCSVELSYEFERCLPNKTLMYYIECYVPLIFSRCWHSSGVIFMLIWVENKHHNSAIRKSDVRIVSCTLLLYYDNEKLLQTIFWALRHAEYQTLNTKWRERKKHGEKEKERQTIECLCHSAISAMLNGERLFLPKWCLYFSKESEKKALNELKSISNPLGFYETCRKHFPIRWYFSLNHYCCFDVKSWKECFFYGNLVKFLFN